MPQGHRKIYNSLIENHLLGIGHHVFVKIIFITKLNFEFYQYYYKNIST